MNKTKCHTLDVFCIPCAFALAKSPLLLRLARTAPKKSAFRSGVFAIDAQGGGLI